MRTSSVVAGAMSIVTSFTITLALSGCGEKMKEAQQAMDNMKNITQNAEKAQEQMNDVQKRREERRAKGDTMAIPYKDLQQYLPASIDGYTAAEPSGESTNVPGMSFSTASRRYTRQGANGEEGIDVKLTDYNGSSGMYDGVAMVLSLGISTDNDNETSKTYKLDYPYSGAVETYRKKDKRGELKYALGGRFWLEITADNQSSIDGVKNIAKSMKIAELANK